MKSEAIQSVFRSPKWEIKPKLHRYPPKRWGHTGVLIKNKLYIYGGKTGRLKEPLYEFDCDTFQCHMHEMSGFPESRQSHSCSLIKEKLIIWGGCRQDKALNDCLVIQFKDRHCYWTQLAQFPILKQRESHATTVLKDKYILLYGGSNEDEIYEDFWIFNTDVDVWFQIKNVVGKMKKRLGCTLTVVRDKVYMFGGQGEDGRYENQVYRIGFSQMEFCSQARLPEMRCQKLMPTGVFPPGRSSHSAINYADRFLIIIAGQGQGQVKGKPASVLLNDVWSFDTEKLVWQPVEIPNRSIFKPRSCFSANLYRNKIYIFGGLLSIEQNFKPSDQLITLSFSQNNEKPLDLCNLCKLHYRPFSSPSQSLPQPITQPSRSTLSLSLASLYKLARQIRNPFDAICLILQAFQVLGYRGVAIDVIEGKVCMVQGSGVGLNEDAFAGVVGRYQFVEEIGVDDGRVLEALGDRVEEQKLQIFGFNIKNACARLGQTFILINRRSSLVDLALFTPQNLHYCQLNTQDNTVSPQQEPSYQIIHNYMHKNNLNIALLEDETFTIVVTDLGKVSAMQSQMRVNGKNVVELVGQGGGGQGQGGKRVSLQGYVAGLFLRKPQMTLSINTKNIQFRDQQTHYKSHKFQPTTQHTLSSLYLRESQKQSQLALYRNGLRIGRYTPKGLPYIEGYVEVPLSYELSLMRNRLERAREVQGIVEGLVREWRDGVRKRRSGVGIQELENGARNG